MLIQSSANMAPPPQAAKSAKEGVAVAIAAQPPQAEPKPATPPNSPQPPVRQAVEAKSVQQVSAEQLKHVAENINKALKESGRSLEFSVDKDTNKQVFRLLDTETGDVIRQFPTDEMLAISRAIDKFQQDVLLQNKQDLRLTDQIQQGLLLRQEA